MILNSANYSTRQPDIVTWVTNKAARGDFDLLKEIGYIALGTNVPIIIVTHFVLQMEHSEEMRAKLEEMKTGLMEFYGVKDVV